MEKVKIEPEDYEPFRYVDDEKLYTRNLVMENDVFTIIALVWNPSKASPIHDHPCDGCWVRVLEGNVQETCYEHNKEEKTLEEISDNIYHEGQITWMHDIKGYHKIGNPTDKPAVTLHVYSPPFKAANKINPDGSKELCVINYDTEGGVRTEVPEDN